MKLDRFTEAYLECAAWLSDGDGIEDPEEAARFRAASWAPEAIEQARQECAAFQEANAADLAEIDNAAQSGHDFWLTRNGHGAGFWDRGIPEDIEERLTVACGEAGQRDTEVGDDGYLYFFPGLRVAP